MRVFEVMTEGVQTVPPGMPASEGWERMRGRTIGSVSVVDGERLVGSVTVSDLLEALGRGVDRPAKETRRMATHRVPHRKTRRAGGAW